MNAGRQGSRSYLPPYILEAMAKSGDQRARELAFGSVAMGAALRMRREVMSGMGQIAAAIPFPGDKGRVVFDLEHKEAPLPGRLVRAEGNPNSGDPCVDEAYEHSGTTFDFYNDVVDRFSLDGHGMALLSSVRYGEDVCNAFWDGRQTVFGDGESPYFHRFTAALDVVAHEMTHGVINFSSRLEYHDESGALNESFCDIMGALVEQWHFRQSIEEASWFTGGAVIGPELGDIKGIRTFKEDKAFDNHPVLGTDPQPKHVNSKYTGTADNGGVHINSGIPNHAFYRLAVSLRKPAWEVAGQIWYELMISLAPQATFVEAARRSYEIAGRRYGRGNREQRAVSEAWRAVGISP